MATPRKKRKPCLTCGNSVERLSSKYCNTKCQRGFIYQEYIKKWERNEVSGMRKGGQISGHIRRYLFKKYNNKCAECGWAEVNRYTNSIPLEVEHKDGDYRNNKESNLTLICPNCHSLTSTYKGANRGRGRPGRVV